MKDSKHAPLAHVQEENRTVVVSLTVHRVSPLLILPLKPRTGESASLQKGCFCQSISKRRGKQKGLCSLSKLNKPCKVW